MFMNSFCIWNLVWRLQTQYCSWNVPLCSIWILMIELAYLSSLYVILPGLAQFSRCALIPCIWAAFSLLSCKRQVAKICFIAWYCYNTPPHMLGFQAHRGFRKCVPSVLFALVCLIWEPCFLHHYHQRKLTSRSLKKTNCYTKMRVR